MTTFRVGNKLSYDFLTGSIPSENGKLSRAIDDFKNVGLTVVCVGGHDKKGALCQDVPPKIRRSMAPIAGPLSSANGI